MGWDGRGIQTSVVFQNSYYTFLVVSYKKLVFHLYMPLKKYNTPTGWKMPPACFVDSKNFANE